MELLGHGLEGSMCGWPGSRGGTSWTGMIGRDGMWMSICARSLHDPFGTCLAG